MAGPSIVVRVLGDLKGLGKSFDDAKTKGDGVAKSMSAGFSTMLAAVNRTGVLGPFGEALDGLNETVETIIENGKKIGPSIAAAGTALAGIGLGLTALGSKDQAAHQQLAAAVDATGGSYDDYEKQVESAIKSQEKFGDSANVTQDALTALVEATHNPTKALSLLSTATDVAAAKHENLQQAAVDVGKVYNGNTKLLKEFGITVDKTGSSTKGLETATTKANAADKALTAAKQHLADVEAIDAGKKHLTAAEAINLRNAQQKVTDATATAKGAHEKLTAAQDAAKKSAGKQTDATTLLANVTKGQAAAAADTFTGKVNAVKTKLEDTASSIGQKYGPALTTAGTVTAGLGGAFQATQGIMGHFQKASEDAKDAVKDVQGAEEGAQAASGLLAGASGIGLILLAIAALILIGYELYKHWDTIWSGIKAAAKAVWDWIKANWPLLLGILLGPIALAAALIYKYWGQISAGFKVALAAIKTAWTTFVGWLSGLAGSIARIASGMWHGVSDAFGTALAAIKTGWSIFWGWFTGLPGDIAGAASGMWSGIYGAFKSAVDSVIGLWNTLASYTALHIHIGIPHLPGINVDTPQLIPSIPKLAQGGLITRDGLIYAHAGEAISPAPAGVGGPAVVVQSATFAQDIDIDLFMRRVAWSLQKARI